MNAGQMLGLLAGAGALNALGGGKDGKRFNSIVDMFDGGGAGQSGDKFEGGGLMSMLGNLFAKPYEAQDRVEQIAARTAMRNAPTTPAAQLSSRLDTKGITPTTPALSGEDLLMSMPVSPSAETNKMGAMLNVPSAYDYASMGQQDIIDLPEIEVAGEYTLPSVEGVLQDRATSPSFGPLAALNAQEYLEYLRTGRYPSGY
jgi:hypothetical protein